MANRHLTNDHLVALLSKKMWHITGCIGHPVSLEIDNNAFLAFNTHLFEQTFCLLINPIYQPLRSGRI